MLAQHDAPPTTQPGAETRAIYCQRCDNARPLGIISPGRYWTRTNGRTVLVEGGRVTVTCEKCQKSHTIDLMLTG